MDMASFDYQILRLTINRTSGSQKNVTFQEHNEIMNGLSVFKVWFVDHYMNRSQTTIIALHIDKVQPGYRTQYPTNNNPNVPAIRPTFLAAILGPPGLAIPSKSSWVFQISIHPSTSEILNILTHIFQSL